MDAPQPNEEKKKGFWENIPFFLKFLIGAGAAMIVFFIFFGGFNANNIFEFILKAALFMVMAYMLYFAIQRILAYFQPKPFSPKENLLNRMVNMATSRIPEQNRGKSLWITGSHALAGAEIGRLTGILQIPLFIGKAKKDANGKIIYMLDQNKKPTSQPERDIVQADDFEYFFVVRKGRFLPKFMFVRCHQKYVLSMESDVKLKTANLVPTVSLNYFYPFEQIFEDAQRAMLEHMSENILMTFDYQGDLVASTTDHALLFNPHWQYARKVGQESITSVQG